MNIRVLLVESEPEDVNFLKDVLMEIEAGRHWQPFVSFVTAEAHTWSDAATALAGDAADVVLLNPNLPDCYGMETFRRSQAIAPQAPIILLILPEDQSLAIRMMREGAQDFLIRKSIDCEPLVHAMRGAIERQRLLASARAGSVTDSLTGLPNRSAFLTMADRDRKLAERLGRRMMILLVQPKHLAEIASVHGDQRRDLTLVEAADHLRSIAGPTEIVGRVAPDCFAMGIFETGAESLETAWSRIHSGADAHRVRVGAAIFDPERPASLDALLECAEEDLLPLARSASR